MYRLLITKPDSSCVTYSSYYLAQIAYIQAIKISPSGTKIELQKGGMSWQSDSLGGWSTIAATVIP
jgi:hypothetical protein